MSPELGDDHIVAMCRVLIDHDVGFVFSGGMAARLHDTGLGHDRYLIAVHRSMTRTSRGLRSPCEISVRGFASKASRRASR